MRGNFAFQGNTGHGILAAGGPHEIFRPYAAVSCEAFGTTIAMAAPQKKSARQTLRDALKAELPDKESLAHKAMLVLFLNDRAMRELEVKLEDAGDDLDETVDLLSTEIGGLLEEEAKLAEGEGLSIFASD